MIQSLFAEMFSKNDWLMVWDHMITNPPAFMYHFVIAYLVNFRKALLKTNQLKDFYYFFQRRNATNVSKIILKAYDIMLKTPTSIDPGSALRQFEPCSRDEYPIFNQYPQFIVNYQSKMKEQIRQEEQEYIKKRFTLANETTCGRTWQIDRGIEKGKATMGGIRFEHE